MAAALSIGVASSAAAQGGAGIPVIVMVDDSDKSSVVRSSDIHDRVIAELQRQLANKDFYVIDEDAIAARLDWDMADRRDKKDLFKIVDLACKSNDSTLCGRAMVVFRIRAAAKNEGFGTAAQVRLTGNIYDVASNKYLNGWEPMRMEFPAPQRCNQFCIEEVVGDNARDIAASLGDVLSDQLSYLTRGGAYDVASPDTDPGLINSYQITFRNFRMKELILMTDMIESFPDGVRVDDTSGDQTVYKYNFRSRMKSSDLYKNLNTLLVDMDYQPHEFRVSQRGNRVFSVEKLINDTNAARWRSGSRN
ncbi:MAG: hypothetical protein AAGC56_01210 [Pseudomonadota bacterium]